MAKSTLSTLITLLLTATTLAAPRRHAVQPPAGWTPSAFSTTESNGDVSDLAPIGPLVGDATLIGLGDGTHGTHEYFATKRRIIEYLVRNKDFDEVDFEGEFLHFAKIDAYINGAPGDAKQLVLSPPDIYYFFWEVQELADVVEWMRDYNLHRVPGVRAIHVGGADIYGVVEAAVDATKYLDRVDPAAADNARAASGCVSLTMPQQCELGFAAIRDAALAHEAAYVASTSQREFDDAVHEMDLVANYSFGNRDRLMAANAVWLRDHHSATRKSIFWAHQEHTGQKSFIVSPTAGFVLTSQLGASYFIFGNATYDGSFLTTTDNNQTKTTAFLPLTSDGYEVNLHAIGAPRLIVPLRGPLPAWLSETHHFRAGDAAAAYDHFEPVTRKFDAVIWIETTTPNHWLR